MSISSKVIETVFRMRGAAQPISTEKFYRKLRKSAVAYRKGEKAKGCTHGVKRECGVYCGMRYLAFTPKQVDASSLVMYLHGSGYMNSHHAFQERFAASIAKNTHLRVFFPIYPKLPASTAVASIAVLNNFYSFLLKQGDVILAGDSSGAALCLSLAAERKEAHTVAAISPWLRLDLDERAEKMCATDVVLPFDTLRCTAKLWAKDLPFSAVKVSPMYGDFSGKNILLFAAEKELFCPYAREFYERKLAEGANVRYVEGKGQQHDYPLMPTPEGRAARSLLYQAIWEAVYQRGVK